MTKKVTAFTVHPTGEGQRAAFTYSVINDDGSITQQNERAEVILVDDKALAAAQTLYDFLQEKIPD